MDLSQLSDDDVLALSKGDMTQMSDQGLQLISKAQAQAQAPPAPPSSGWDQVKKVLYNPDADRPRGQIPKTPEAQKKERDQYQQNLPEALGETLGGSALAALVGPPVVGAGVAAATSPFGKSVLKTAGGYLLGELGLKAMGHRLGH